MEFGAKLSLKDNMSSTLQKNLDKQKEFQRDIQQTRKAIQQVSKEKLKINTDTSGITKAVKETNQFKAKMREMHNAVFSPVIKVKDLATKAISKVKSGLKATGSIVASPFIKIRDGATRVTNKIRGGLEKVGKMFTPIVKLKDMASNMIGSIYGGLKRVGSFVAKPMIALKDGASKALSNIGGMLKTLAKGATIGLAVAGAGAMALLKKGGMLEQQQISIEHFVGVNNKDKSQDQIKKMSDDYMKELRNNANLTPFSTDEVIGAGSRALNVAGGDTSGAMSMLRVAQDMAALNPEKSLSDAIEAIADMKNGETERMKEFGFKISADDIKSAGGTEAIIKNQLAPYFEGGAAKLSQSGSGLASTITGNISSALSNTGLAMLEKAKPFLEKMVNLTNTMAPKMEAIGGKIAEGFGMGIEWLSGLLDKAGGLTPVFSAIGSTIKGVFSGLKPVIESIIPVVGNMASTFLPVLQNIGGMVERIFPKVANTISKAFSGAGGGIGIFGNMINAIIPPAESIINNLLKAFDLMMPVIGSLGAMIARIFPVIGSTISQAIGYAMPVFESFKNIVASAIPIVEGIISIFCSNVRTVMPVVSKIFKGVGDKVAEVIDFMAGKMGFIKEIYATIMPIISGVLSTAWDIISPIMDIMISVFEAVFDVVEFVWPAIQAVIETVWGVLEPIFGAIADALTWVGDAVDSVIGWFGNVFDGVFDSGSEGSTKKDDGASRAMGVQRIPYDNYPMRAHEGEMLLTKREANNYVAQTRGVGLSEKPTAVSGSSSNTSTVTRETATKQETKQVPPVINITNTFPNATFNNIGDVDELTEQITEKQVRKLEKLLVNMA